MLTLQQAEALARLTGLTRHQVCALHERFAGERDPLAALMDAARTIAAPEPVTDDEHWRGMPCRVCGKRARARGLCPRHYREARRNGELGRYATRQVATR